MFDQYGMQLGLLNAKCECWGHQDNLDYMNLDVLVHEKTTRE